MLVSMSKNDQGFCRTLTFFVNFVGLVVKAGRLSRDCIVGCLNPGM